MLHIVAKPVSKEDIIESLEPTDEEFQEAGDEQCEYCNDLSICPNGKGSEGCPDEKELKAIRATEKFKAERDNMGMLQKRILDYLDCQKYTGYNDARIKMGNIEFVIWKEQSIEDTVIVRPIISGKHSGDEEQFDFPRKYGRPIHVEELKNKVSTYIMEYLCESLEF